MAPLGAAPAHIAEECIIQQLDRYKTEKMAKSGQQYIHTFFPGAGRPTTAASRRQPTVRPSPLPPKKHKLRSAPFFTGHLAM